MADPVILSKPYPTRNDAAIGGFKRVLKNGEERKTKEFAFWVIVAVNAKHVPEYFYTTPVTDNSGSGVSAVFPDRHIVRAFCHTHPSRIASGDFGYDDKLSFVALQKKRPNIVWYLLNPQLGIRLAQVESDFLTGIDVDLRDEVQP